MPERTQSNIGREVREARGGRSRPACRRRPSGARREHSMPQRLVGGDAVAADRPVGRRRRPRSTFPSGSAAAARAARPGASMPSSLVRRIMGAMSREAQGRPSQGFATPESRAPLRRARWSAGGGCRCGRTSAARGRCRAGAGRWRGSRARRPGSRPPSSRCRRSRRRRCPASARRRPARRRSRTGCGRGPVPTDVGRRLRERRAAELGGEQHQRVVEHAALLQVAQQRRDRLVDAQRLLRRGSPARSRGRPS